VNCTHFEFWIVDGPIFGFRSLQLTLSHLLVMRILNKVTKSLVRSLNEHLAQADRFQIDRCFNPLRLMNISIKYKSVTTPVNETAFIELHA
jgi:hypothetical protein